MSTAAKDSYRAIGVISGTSMDAIDVALVTTDGKDRATRGPGGSYPYPPALREQLLAVIADTNKAKSDPLANIEAAVTQSHGDAIAQFLKENGIEPQTIDVIGLHGQTVYHRPEQGITRQLGRATDIAARFGVTTVGRFRDADVAAGGQGAPLVPLYHKALAAGLPQPVVVLNLGGVGNLTYIDSDRVIAFDTGPANAMVDDFVRKRQGKAFDAGGALAASGKPDDQLVKEFARHPFFARTPPKSLDRNDFHDAFAAVDRLSDADGAATLTEFTVRSLVAAQDHLPDRPLRWLVTGGGRNNAHLIRRLAAELQAVVQPVEAVGWAGDFLEAECFGYLAVRSLLGLPLSLPATTGVPRPLTGGEVVRA
jgi:anhydro-N-acetylmuramic acid kinase